MRGKLEGWFQRMEKSRSHIRVTDRQTRVVQDCLVAFLGDAVWRVFWSPGASEAQKLQLDHNHQLLIAMRLPSYHRVITVAFCSKMWRSLLTRNFVD